MLMDVILTATIVLFLSIAVVSCVIGLILSFNESGGIAIREIKFKSKKTNG